MKYVTVKLNFFKNEFGYVLINFLMFHLRMSQKRKCEL